MTSCSLKRDKKVKSSRKFVIVCEEQGEMFVCSAGSSMEMTNRLMP